MLRKRKITKIEILLVSLFQNIFSNSPFSSTFFLRLAIVWTNILVYCLDLYQVQFQTIKTNSSMFS